MSSSALFVDLPNFYSELIRTGMISPKELREYFLHWFDFDRLAQFLTGETSNTWVFYSGGRLGPSDGRILDNDLTEFIKRSNARRGVTVRDVNIPGKQRESLNYKCPNCGHEELDVEWNSEKGIDASLIVHLFDTMDSWDAAYLVSGDADYVPAVASLRRRGKIVVGAGFPSVSPALVRECYDYIDLRDEFFGDDISAFMLCNPNGLLKKWMLNVKPDTSTNLSETLTLNLSYYLNTDKYGNNTDTGQIRLEIRGTCDMTEWRQDFSRMPKGKFEISVARGGNYIPVYFVFSEISYDRIRQVLMRTIADIEKTTGIKQDNPERYCGLNYLYNHDSSQYEIVQV